ncbi:unnamed protein product [Rhizophagus irregularis]|nr:unnamed protein product [Rhizophagus irregularis]
MTSFYEWIDKIKRKDGDIEYINYNEFNNVKTVGEGAFGIVESADWKSYGIKAALKTLISNPKIDKDILNNFVKEFSSERNWILWNYKRALIK